MITGTVLGSVNLRAGPGSTYADVGDMFAGYAIEASENVNQWLHITKINGTVQGPNVWASAGASEQYISWEVVSDPPPSDPPPSSVTLTHTIEVYSDGSIKIDGVPY